MNKLLIALLFSAFMITSCTRVIPSCESCDFDCLEEVNESVISSSNCLEDHTCDFEILMDTKVDHDVNEGTKDSNNSFVIKFSTETQGSPNIADDEFYTAFLLEIPDVNDSFSVSGEDVKDLKASMRRTCFCPFVDWKFFEDGCVQGEKIDGTWYVQGELKVDYYDSGDQLAYKFDFKVQ